MALDRDHLHFAWDRMEDPEAATAHCLDFWDEVRRGVIDPVASLDDLEIAYDPATDGPEADPDRVLRAILNAEAPLYDAESRLGIGTPEQIRLRGRSRFLVARGHYRAGRYRQALLGSFQLIKWLEEVAGGRHALLDVIGRPIGNPVAEAAVKVLGLFIASLRRATASNAGELGSQIGAQVATDLYRIGFDLTLAYLGPEFVPRVLYPGAAATGAQWFYRWVGDRAVPDQLVLAAYALDKSTRPDQERSRVTAEARDAEHAGRFGEAEVARERAHAFVSGLRRCGMERHLAAVHTYGYFGL